MFRSAVVGGRVPQEFVRAVEAGCRDALAEGPLGGHPVTGLRVTLTDGQTHVKDSSDTAFRTAGRFGLRDALRASEMVLLEPVVEVTVTVPEDAVGGDARRPRGAARPGHRLRDAGRAVPATVPLAELFGYATRLLSRTQGAAEPSPPAPSATHRRPPPRRRRGSGRGCPSRREGQSVPAPAPTNQPELLGRRPGMPWATRGSPGLSGCVPACTLVWVRPGGLACRGASRLARGGVARPRTARSPGRPGPRTARSPDGPVPGLRQSGSRDQRLPRRPPRPDGEPSARRRRWWESPSRPTVRRSRSGRPPRRRSPGARPAAPAPDGPGPAVSSGRAHSPAQPSSSATAAQVPGCAVSRSTPAAGLLGLRPAGARRAGAARHGGTHASSSASRPGRSAPPRGSAAGQLPRHRTARSIDQ